MSDSKATSTIKILTAAKERARGLKHVSESTMQQHQSDLTQLDQITLDCARSRQSAMLDAINDLASKSQLVVSQAEQIVTATQLHQHQQESHTAQLIEAQTQAQARQHKITLVAIAIAALLSVTVTIIMH